MKLDEVLTLPKFKATFIERINRFVVRAELEGKLIQAYLPNPGKLLELLLPGETLILTLNRSQGRKVEDCKANKLLYLVLAVLKDGEPVLLHTHLTNRIIADLIKQGKIPLYEGYEVLAFEPSFQGSRFDLFLGKDGERRLVEVKTCTLFNDKVAMFPDAVSQRGTKHLLSLAKAKKWGYVPQCLFVVMSRKPDYFLPAFHIDLAFAYAFLEVRNSVELRAIAISADESLETFNFVKEVKIPFERLENLVKDSGVYLLVIEVRNNLEVEVGALGRIDFKPGYYAYVGSARVNLQKRIERHKRKEKPLKWHIDYLTTRAKVLADFPIRSEDISECELARMVKRFADAEVPKFGSSDCQCESHLFYFSENPLRSKDFVYLITDLRLRV